jgi:hypothetical protein
MKTFFFSITLITISNLCVSQGVQFSFGANYGSYNLSDIKLLRNDFRQQLLSSLPISIATVNDFPSHVGFDLQILFTQKKFNMGGFASINSTGSRLYYGDYSGHLTFDQLLKSIGIGGLIEFIPSKKENKRAKFIVSSKAGIALNSYDLDYVLQLGQSVDLQQLSFRSTNIFMMPGIGFKKKIGAFHFQPEIRYLIDIPGNLKLSTDSNLTLNKPNGDTANASWSGFRIAISIGYEKKIK